MMDYLAGAVEFPKKKKKLFQVENWVAANGFFWRDESKENIL